MRDFELFHRLDDPNRSRTHEFFDFWFQDDFRAEAVESKTCGVKKYDLGFSYIGSDDFSKHSAVRTFKTLRGLVDNKQNEYFKPNTFWMHSKSTEEGLRWLNGFVIDLDMKWDLMTVFDVIQRVGLPQPTMVNRTPSGGSHIFWKFKERVWASPKSLYLYKLILTKMNEAVFGDKGAVKTTQYYRIPRNISWFEPFDLYDFSLFKSWLHAKYPEHDPSSDSYFLKRGRKAPLSGRLLDTEALQVLLQGVEDGCRSNAAYALACVLRQDGYSDVDALDFMVEWNELNRDKGGVSKYPLSYACLVSTVNSAFKKDNLPLKWIEEITGVRVQVSFWCHFKKERSERNGRDDLRNYNHSEEWLEDILTYLKNNGSIKGSQVALANLLGLPLSTFKLILKKLKMGDIKTNIVVEVEGRGRLSKTILKLKETKITYSQFKRKEGYRFPVFNDAIFDYGIVASAGNERFEAFVCNGAQGKYVRGNSKSLNSQYM